MKIVCKVLGHKHADNVWDDGLDYRSKCRRCAEPMIRDVRSGWRVFDRERDFAIGRAPKPGRP